MRDGFTRLVGISLVAIGAIWLLDLAVDIGVPWEWVVPVLLIILGAALLLVRTTGPAGGPPSQFERDDAPRVP